MAYFAGMEDQFCKDFSCCGIKLRDLHELLQHFEENHVILESDMEEDDDLPFIIDNVQDVEMGDYSDNKKSRNAQTGSVALSDIYQSDNHHLSAFDTSIIRKRMQPSPPQPWRQTVESPPNTFPITLEGPTKYIRNQDAMETEPVNESPAPPEVQDEEMEEVADRDDRPYKCKIVGCNKSYKNPGGLKYHMHHGHCEDTGDPEMNNIIHKPYQCTVADCAKRYKNLNGLKVTIFNSSIILNMRIATYWESNCKSSE